LRRILTLRGRIAPLVPLGLYLLSMALTSAFFLPHLSEIGRWDEASYIVRGLSLLHGSGAPRIAESPLIMAFFALCASPFQNSPFWLVDSASLGRFVLLSLLWLSAYLISRRLHPYAFPVILVGLLFVHPFQTGMVQLSSDALFTSLAGLSFWQLLSFYHERRLRYIWGASFFMGLAALARNDGLVLYVILLFLTVILSLRAAFRWRALIACLTPFLTIVAGYFLIYGALTGDFNPGIMERTYDAFEAGHESILTPSGEINPTVEAHIQAREVFGTPQENGYSVFRAILRNPSVYLERLGKALGGIPATAWYVYGGRRFAGVIFLLALRGLLELLRRRQYTLMLIFLLWPLQLASGFLTTYFRDDWLLFSYYVPFSLAAVGLTALLKNLEDWRERASWTLLMSAFALLGLWVGSKPMMFAGGAFLGICWGAFFLRRQPSRWRETYASAALGGFLVAGIMVRAGFPGLRIRQLGSEAPEQALLTMVHTLPRGAVVAAGSPAVVWAANMSYLGLAGTDVPYWRPPEAFLDWMVSQNTAAIYADDTLIEQNPAVWDRIRPFIGRSLTPIFEGDGGAVQLLLVGPTEGAPGG
jgi:hypothetical protein